MFRRSRSLRSVASAFLLLSSAATGCTGPEAPVIEGRSDAIVNGTLETQEPAVVLVPTINAQGQVESICTGTLVAPNVVLTAKHCVQQPGANSPLPPDSLAVVVGPSLDDYTQVQFGAQITTTPGAYYTNNGLQGALVGQDVAFIRTEAPLTGVTPYKIRTAPINQVVGQTLVAIGYGLTPQGELGVKYRTTTVIQEVDGGVAYTGVSTCQGDSGGPLLDPVRGEVVATTSFGNGEGCDGTIAGFNRLDIPVVQQMMTQVLGDAAECAANDVTNDGVDDDCDGLIDEDYVAPGQPRPEPQPQPEGPFTPGNPDPQVGEDFGAGCDTGADCASGICATMGGTKMCTSYCDVTAEANACGAGFSCVPAANSNAAVCAIDDAPGGNGGSQACSVSPSSPNGGLLSLVMAGLAMIAVGRRRRR